MVVIIIQSYCVEEMLSKKDNISFFECAGARIVVQLLPVANSRGNFMYLKTYILCTISGSQERNIYDKLSLC
jgi:hypothetical protein